MRPNLVRLFVIGLTLCWTLPSLSPVAYAQNRGGPMLQISRGDSESAIDHLNWAIGMNPENASLYYKRGVCFYFDGNYKLAAEDFEHAASVDGTDSNFQLWLGKTYSMLGDDPKSIKAYVRALQLNPGLLNPEERGVSTNHEEVLVAGTDRAPMKLSQTKKQPVRDERSVRNYLVAVKIVTEHLETQFVPGDVFSGLDRPEYPQDKERPYLQPDDYQEIIKSPTAVLKRYKELLKDRDKDTTNGDLARAHFFRALASQELHDNGKALSEFNDAMQLNPNDASFYLARALLHHNRGEDLLAQKDVAKAQQLDANLPRKISFYSPRPVIQRDAAMPQVSSP